MLIPMFVSLFFIASVVKSQTYKSYTNGFFRVEAASDNDSYYLNEVFRILEAAKTDLERDWGFELNDSILLRVHPNLASYIRETEMPWYVAAVANIEEDRIDTQRLRVLIERNSLTKTLRHELFHLAQPKDWPRWRAEGSAMLFAHETPKTYAILEITEDELNALLENPHTHEELSRASATALSWVIAQRGSREASK